MSAARPSCLPRPEQETERLVHENRKLVDYVVNRYLKRYFVGAMEREDLVSWGLIGLVRAARAWDPSRGYAFSTLACRAIERMIIRGVRQEWRPEREQTLVSLDHTLSGHSEVGETRFVEQLSAPDDLERDLLHSDVASRLHAALDCLTPEQRDLIRRHYFDGVSVQELAREYGLSRQGIYAREKVIFRHLRELLGDPYATAA